MGNSIQISHNTAKLVGVIAKRLQCSEAQVIDGMMVLAANGPPTTARSFAEKSVTVSTNKLTRADLVSLLSKLGDDDEADEGEEDTSTGDDLVDEALAKSRKPPKSKSEAWSRIEAAANNLRKMSEQPISFEAAVDQTLRARPLLYTEWCLAVDDESAHAEPSHTKDQWTGRTAEKMVHDQIERRALEIKKAQPHLSHAQAYVEALKTPGAYEKHLQAQRIDRAAS